jgi:hypothetical protein
VEKGPPYGLHFLRLIEHHNQRVSYGPGEIFAVAQDHPHDEEVGPEGARVLVGRKYGKA